MLAATSQSVATMTEARIRDAGQLKVCIWPEYYGVTYRNPHTRALSGIDIDLSHALASDLGVDLVYVDSSFVSLVDDLLTERCEIGMFAIVALAQRANLLSFSNSYMQSGIYAITTKGQRQIRVWSDIDQLGVVVGVQAGSFMEPVMRDSLTQASVVVVRPPMNREKELLSGRIDVFMTDYPNGRRVLDRNDSIRLITPDIQREVLPYAYALKPGDQGWLLRVNQFVETIKRDGRLERAAQQHGMAPMVVK
jgi:ABC-type amino acid transport substrate-binding protein